jgi:hypothetical protein
MLTTVKGRRRAEDTARIQLAHGAETTTHVHAQQQRAAESAGRPTTARRRHCVQRPRHIIQTAQHSPHSSTRVQVSVFSMAELYNATHTELLSNPNPAASV